MPANRRSFLGSAAVMAAANLIPTAAEGATEMYGTIGKITATAGQRDALIAILSESTTKMPGCLSYIIAKDSADADSVWITEIWDSKTSHDASLSLPAVKSAIAKARPIMAGFTATAQTQPVAGVGLPTQPQ